MSADDVNEKLSAKSAELQQEREATTRRERDDREERVLRAATITRDDLFTVYENVDLSDQTSVDTALNRFSQCSALLSGESVGSTSAPVETPSVVSAEAAASDDDGPRDILYLDNLSDTQRAVIELVRDNPGRFRLMEFEAVTDTWYTKLRKQFEAEQAKDDGKDDSSDSSTSSAQAKKTAARAEPKAKKAAPPKRQKDESTEDKPEGFLDKVLKSAKKGIENTKK